MGYEKKHVNINVYLYELMFYFSTFKLNVTYRRNCDFKVEDSERDLSAQFIDMDEQFFTPTMAKYQQEYAKPRPVSMYSPTSKVKKKKKNIIIHYPLTSHLY